MTARDLFTEPQPAVVEVPRGTCGDCFHGAKPKHGYIRCSLRPWVMQAPGMACHLEPVRWEALTEERKAKRDAQAGIDQAVSAANRQHDGWSDLGYAFIELYCSQNKGSRCTGHDIVKASVEKGVIQPGNAKAWGGPLQRASRAGLLKRVGYTEDGNRHGAPIPLWEVA